MKLELVVRRGVSHVELQKDEKHRLGITIADGTRNEAGPVVKKVKLKSPAGKSYAVHEGDVILSLNGSSMVGTKSRDIIRMIKEAGNAIYFKMQYERREIRISQPGVFRRQQQKIELHKTKDSFGFVLRKNEVIHPFAEEYPVISNIKEGSHVHRDGRIHEGDRLLKVDEVSLSCLSLPDIARMLQAESKAEFTFEYNIGVVNFSEATGKVDLDIDVPTADLGMCLTTDSEESGLMYIKNIRSGSITERCGLFSEGEIILSINEIDTNLLTASKANMLLQSNKKRRKISFIPSKRKAKSSHSESISEKCGSEENDTATSRSYCNQDWKHFNTPASSNIAFPVKKGICCQNVCFDEQIKSINKLQNIARVMKNLKQILSRLNCEKKSLPLSENCTFCDASQHSAKLCASCVAKMNATFTQSMDVLQNMVTHFVTLANPGKAEKNIEENEISENNLLKVSMGEVVHALAETLPEVFSEESHLGEQFQALAKKIVRADTSCNVCDYEVKSVCIIVQKLLLLLSLEYNRPEIKDLIKQLLCALINTKFSCDSKQQTTCPTPTNLSNSKHSYVDDCCFPSENLSTPSVSFTVVDDSSSESDANTTQTNIQSEATEMLDVDQRSLNIPQIIMRKDYLKIIHIQSLSASEEFNDENDLCEADMDGKSPVENDRVSLHANNLESSSTSLKLEETANSSDKKIYNDKGLSLTPAKVWRSLDSILRHSKASKEQPETQNKLSPNPNKSTLKNSNGMAQGAPSTSSRYPANRLSTSHKPVKNGKNTSDTNNDESTPSSCTNPSQKESRTSSKKIRTDTVEVKMINNGEGFGLILGARYSSSKSSVVPVIHTIKPKSPSQRSGVLKIDDRIIAINQRGTLGLSPKELQTLKKRSFSADAVSLTVEFDIEEAELKTGTFDVVLDKTLKIGLIFEDLQRGNPMVVSGIVKGSGAHRSGQLFPGDKVKFLRCIRTEEFDPVSCNYTKEESVLITVQRDRIEGLPKKPASSSPCYLNPCFSHQDSVPRRGRTFVVRSSSIHVVEGTDALVLDQQVTLFRDPVFWDFGFLVGENPVTGRAYVTDVRPDGPACESGAVKKFDRILEVNGISVDKNVENSVLSLLSQANHRVDLLIRRLYHEDSSSV